MASYQSDNLARASLRSYQTWGKALLIALPLTVMSAASLSGCSFHLRGLDAPLRLNNAKTVVLIEEGRTAFPLKLPLTERIGALGTQVVDGMALIDGSTDNPQDQSIGRIEVQNVRFQNYELVGVLTEIRLVLSADVSYQALQNGQPVTLTNTIQVDRSYQYNEASVSTDDLQGAQIRDWLYDALARRIADQYVAISLPQVAPPAPDKAP